MTALTSAVRSVKHAQRKERLPRHVLEAWLASAGRDQCKYDSLVLSLHVNAWIFLFMSQQCVTSRDKVDRFFWNDLMYTFTRFVKEGGRRNPAFVRWVMKASILRVDTSQPHRTSSSFAIWPMYLIEQRTFLYTISREYHGKYSTLIIHLAGTCTSLTYMLPSLLYASINTTQVSGHFRCIRNDQSR